MEVGFQMRIEDTYGYHRDAKLAEWTTTLEGLRAELEDAIRKAPALRPVLAPFVRMLGGDVPRTRFGMFVERVRIEYALLRLERRLARARTVKR